MAQVIITIALLPEQLTAEVANQIKSFEAMVAPVPVRTTGESTGKPSAGMSNEEAIARKTYKETYGKNFRLTKDHIRRGLSVVDAIAEVSAMIQAGGAIPDNGDASDPSLPDADSVEIY